MIRLGEFLTADGCRLRYEIAGRGKPVLWQHGLGATSAQPAEVFPQNLGLQRITLLCRGHGDSELGDPVHLSIRQFADDAVALLDHLEIDHAAIGGISLGAALALNLAARYPARVSQLVLARPAWVDEPAPETLQLYTVVAQLLANFEPAQALYKFHNLPEFRALQETSPDNANSLIGFFTRPRPDTTIALLSRIPIDWPGVTRTEMTEIKIPTLVIGNGEDHVHPLSFAQTLAKTIPGAQFLQITSKTVNREAYVREFQDALTTFLNPH